MRFDIFVAKKLNISRNKAIELIQNQKIICDNTTFKPSFDMKKYAKNNIFDKDFSDEELLKIFDIKLLENIYVSRAAFKLKSFIDEYKINISNKTCLDIGASAGGFSQVLLEYDALKVVAIDVGSDQLNPILKQNPKLKYYENTDIRAFKSDESFDIVLCDVSFISIEKILFCINNFAKDLIILLFKPQFEVGKNIKRNKKGVIKNKDIILKSKNNFEKQCQKLNWDLKISAKSSLKGKEGNEEYFYLYSKK